MLWQVSISSRSSGQIMMIHGINDRPLPLADVVILLLIVIIHTNDQRWWCCCLSFRARVLENTFASVTNSENAVGISLQRASKMPVVTDASPLFVMCNAEVVSKRLASLLKSPRERATAGM